MKVELLTRLGAIVFALGGIASYVAAGSRRPRRTPERPRVRSVE